MKCTRRMRRKRMVKKTRVVRHVICSKCGACFFDDRPAAEMCFDSHRDEIKGGLKE
jgi:uncharacterized OB-fold protein